MQVGGFYSSPIIYTINPTKIMLNYYRTLNLKQLIVMMLVGIFLIGGDAFAQKK